MKVHKRFLFGVLSLLFLTSLPGAHGEEIWKIVDGRTTFHFDTDRMEAYGIYLSDVEETTETPDPVEMNMESPYWSFDITEDSDLTFRVNNGVFVPYGFIDGGIHHDGGLTFGAEGLGAQWDMHDFVVACSEEETDGPGVDPDPYALRIRNGSDGSPFIIDLNSAMTRFMPKTQEMVIGRLEVVIGDEWAQAMGRPELAGKVLGLAEIYGRSELIQPSTVVTAPYVPRFAMGGGDTLDVKLGFLSNVDERGREGTYPNGLAGVSMSTTSCNVGNVDVPWLAPMDEDHPGIAMALYRETDTGDYTTFEQIGFSGMKHGFFALSNSDCDPCQHHSDGSFLGVGCSDTYGVGNNADRTWLAPRNEWNPYLGTWECTGSHFAGGQPDCERRHGGSGHDGVEHRVVVHDSDLDNANSTYYYEAYYVVRDDDFKMNNSGSKRCTMQWGGSGWDFNTPSSNNPLVEGPVLLRWDADLHTWIKAETDDGNVILSVKVTDLDLGLYHYEYALYNFDCDRRIGSITIPVNDAGNITDIEFHDGDQDATNDWQFTLGSNALTFETETFEQNENANALMFGWLFNFRFNADAPPQTVNASLGLWKPGNGDAVLGETLAPGSSASLGDLQIARNTVRLYPSRPNPLNPNTTIRFDLAERAPVRLDVFDAAGRRVRTLVDGVKASGTHSLVWDGNAADGRRVSSGVYYYLLKAGRENATQSVVVLQ